MRNSCRIWYKLTSIIGLGCCISTICNTRMRFQSRSNLRTLHYQKPPMLCSADKRLHPPAFSQGRSRTRSCGHQSKVQRSNKLAAVTFRRVAIQNPKRFLLRKTMQWVATRQVECPMLLTTAVYSNNSLSTNPNHLFNCRKPNPENRRPCSSA